MGLPVDPLPDNHRSLSHLIRATQAIARGAEGSGDPTVSSGLYGELGELAKHLHETLKELQAAGDQAREASSALPDVAGELTDLKRFTEEATHRILSSVETALNNHDLMVAQLKCAKLLLVPDAVDVGRMHRYLDELSSLVVDDKKIMMKVLEALEFQDLTGQRLKKLVSALQNAEARLLKWVIQFGPQAKPDEASSQKQAALLNELEASSKKDSLDQRLVDNILREFGF